MDDTFGYPPATWQAAKEQAREAMISTAQQQLLITYTELAARINAIAFQPHDFKLFHLLGQISTSEDGAARGMLTAVVVTAEGRTPGHGFFKLAKELGHAFSDETDFWATQLKRVYKAWSR